MLQKRYRDIIYLIRQIPNIFQKTIFVFLFWVGWRTLTYFLPRIWGGYLSVMHGAIIAVLGCWILFRGNQTQLSAIGSQAFKCFGLAYVAWGLYDFCWGTLHFLKSDHYETATPLANLIVFIRILASSFTTTAILFSIRDSLKTFFHFRLTLFSLFVSTTVYASMLYIAFFQNNPLWLSLVTVSELGATFVAFLLVFVSIVVLLSTINLEWSVFAAGVLCLLLSDFGSRIERLLSHSVSINVYDSIWYFGMDISLLAILSKTPREKIDSLNFSSLFTSYKSGSLIILILCLFFLACAGNLDLQGLKLIVVLGAFSSFA